MLSGLGEEGRESSNVASVKLTSGNADASIDLSMIVISIQEPAICSIDLIRGSAYREYAVGGSWFGDGSRRTRKMRSGGTAPSDQLAGVR